MSEESTQSTKAVGDSTATKENVRRVSTVPLKMASATHLPVW